MKGNLVGSGELGLHMLPGLVARHQVGEVQVLVSELPVEVVLVPQLIGLPKNGSQHLISKLMHVLPSYYYVTSD